MHDFLTFGIYRFPKRPTVKPFVAPLTRDLCVYKRLTVLKHYRGRKNRFDYF